MSYDKPQEGSIELEPVDEAARQAAIEAFKAKAKKAENPTEIKKATMNSLRQDMVVGIVWKDTNGDTWIHPGAFRIKMVGKNGRVALKLVKGPIKRR